MLDRQLLVTVSGSSATEASQLLLPLSFTTLVHRGGFEPPYLLRGTDLQSVGFNHSPTCANPKTPRRAKNNTDTVQHFSSSGNRLRELPPELHSPENTLMECPRLRR